MNNYLLNPPKAINNILSVSEDVIKEQGLCSFKMSVIASRSGCSTKTLYNHFHCKEDIIVALFIQHVNDILCKINMIEASNKLTNQEKIIYTLMYDPVKCWAAEKDNLCVNFLGVNPHILNMASPEFIGNIKVIFLEIKEHTQRLWKKAVNDGELLSGKASIIKRILLMRGIQKGSVVVGQNKYLRQFGYDGDVKPTFNALCDAMWSLDWASKCETLSYGAMLSSTVSLLDLKSEMSQRHYGLEMESLKENIEL
ncbi:TetR/AcrR family transcriptional regulator [Shewanella abyssi]|uniref:TetR/AcrR family transcriptional regulator n=1 Tax=Shewanella abyssi TaxID=311789 RepID=UPI00200EE9A4|nr:TetR/AcrR family transcriptional regulator [Shewanella abyssi]MCL1051744.1 TetR/AcrR family transcriptional regulator [Shewanella abyssi]